MSEEKPPRIRGTAIGARPGATVFYKKEFHIVKVSCRGRAGFWYCATCKEWLPSQRAKDEHIDYPHSGEHVLAWICPVHGIETPV